MNQVFWIGVHPGIDEMQLKYMAETFQKIRTMNGNL
jgi:hypothetical protein